MCSSGGSHTMVWLVFPLFHAHFSSNTLYQIDRINSKYWYLFFAYMYKAISQLNTFAMAIVSCFTHSLLYPFSASPFPSFVNFQLQSFSASPLLSFTNFQLESNFHTNRMENCFYLESIVTPSFSSRPVLFSFQETFFFILSMRWWRSIQAFIFPRIQN